MIWPVTPKFSGRLPMENAGKFYINGKWIDPISSQKMDVINPATEEVITQITLASEEDVDLAVAAAKPTLTANGSIRSRPRKWTSSIPPPKKSSPRSRWPVKKMSTLRLPRPSLH
eukprot:TRINITY_DN22652_c0_g1_i1.p2 TRINITY_DN22652_c0_g1~~TRINITY_DN22652_c0_g1_i1.p2  ORF type:complete len:115 (+),score=14.16 TRINITY_DN22652_c0_g1_i1:745-1089(+)